MVGNITDIMGASSVAFGDSMSSVDMFRKQLDMEMGRISADSAASDSLSLSEGPTAALKSFANGFIGAEQNLRSQLDNLMINQNFNRDVPRVTDVSVTADSTKVSQPLQADPFNFGGQASNWQSVNTANAMGAQAYNTPGPTPLAGSGYNVAGVTPKEGTNEIPLDNEGRQGGLDPIQQTLKIYEDLRGDIRRVTLTNLSVSKSMQEFGRFNAIAQAGTDIARGLVSGLTKGG